MTGSIKYTIIRSELEDHSSGYSMFLDCGNAPNTDYAGYACHLALDRFQHMLDNPDLTADQLESLMRKVTRKHAVDHPEQKWSHVMARFISRHANINTAVDAAIENTGLA